MSDTETAHHLRTLPAIRERCSRVYALAEKGQLKYFDYHPENENDVVDYCIKVMKRDYGEGFSKIPPHGRWRHLDAGPTPRIVPLLSKFESSPTPPDKLESARRLVDLFVVSVLLDAGAGNTWTYTEPGTGLKFSRSEGLGVASVHMFDAGLFSSVQGEKWRVDAGGLSTLTPDVIAQGLQVDPETNPMVGIEGRANLLISLSNALRENPQYFGEEGRPGKLLDYLISKKEASGDKTRVPLSALWSALLDGLDSIWPSRLSLGGVKLGDVWVCEALQQPVSKGEGDVLVPFHKLTQWLTYSILEILEKFLGWEVTGTEAMTGLPEYRNGGLLVDLGVLTLRPGLLPIDVVEGVPYADRPGHPAIVEWRAMTVVELDRIAAQIRVKLGNLTSDQLSLAQVLEAATWKSGREVAKEKRGAKGGGPPISVRSDGTVF